MINNLDISSESTRENQNSIQRVSRDGERVQPRLAGERPGANARRAPAAGGRKEKDLWWFKYLVGGSLGGSAGAVSYFFF